MKVSETTKAIGKHFYWLDSFRFIAALMVVITHTRGTLFVEYAALTEKSFVVTAFFAFTRIANEAVIVFFVLSGFLVGGRALEKIVEGTFQPTTYAVDRFVRIMLPLIPALIITAAVCILVDGSFSGFELIGNIFFLQGIFVYPFGNNAPLWSLSYEVWFYVLAYAVGIFTLNKRYNFLSTSILILITAIFTVLFPVYLFSWLIGAMAYIRRPSDFSWKIFLLAITLCLYSIVAIQVGSKSISVSVEYFTSYFPSLNMSRIFLSAGIAMMIQQVLCLKPKTILMKKLDSLGTMLAASSYTLYLTHVPVLKLLVYLGLNKSDQINISTISIFVITILICLFVGWFVYLLFEKHTDLVKNNIKKWISKENNLLD